MKLQELVSHPSVMRLAMFTSRHTPVSVGRRFAWMAADLICRARPAVYHTVEDNLRAVVGGQADPKALRRLVRGVFYHALRSYFDLYRTLQRPLEEAVAQVDLPEPTRETLEKVRHGGRGTVIATLHLGNFDLAGRALGQLLPGMQVLTLPNPGPGFQLTNALRQQAGIRVTPLSRAALREALQHLKGGGTVVVVSDRPVSELDEPVLFFGRPARIPSGAVRLALKADAQMVLGCCVLEPETERDTLYLEPPVDPIRTEDREEEFDMNMRRLLDAMESVIRKWPEQWLMFVPVWPEQPSTVPRDRGSLSEHERRRACAS